MSVQNIDYKTFTSSSNPQPVRSAGFFCHLKPCSKEKAASIAGMVFGTVLSGIGGIMATTCSNCDSLNIKPGDHYNTCGDWCPQNNLTISIILIAVGVTGLGISCIFNYRMK